jgi:hypothetical protein
MPPRMLVQSPRGCCPPSTFSQCEGCCRIRGAYSEGRFQERGKLTMVKAQAYLKAGKTRKSEVLDDFCEETGYCRRHAALCGKPHSPWTSPSGGRDTAASPADESCHDPPAPGRGEADVSSARALPYSEHPSGWQDSHSDMHGPLRWTSPASPHGPGGSLRRSMTVNLSCWSSSAFGWRLSCHHPSCGRWTRNGTARTGVPSGQCRVREYQVLVDRIRNVVLGCVVLCDQVGRQDDLGRERTCCGRRRRRE